MERPTPSPPPLTPESFDQFLRGRVESVWARITVEIPAELADLDTQIQKCTDALAETVSDQTFARFSAAKIALSAARRDLEAEARDLLFVHLAPLRALVASTPAVAEDSAPIKPKSKRKPKATAPLSPEAELDDAIAKALEEHSA